MSGPAINLVIYVKREQTLDTGAWVWTGLPQDYPGSAGGRSIAELHEEVEALKHFITGADPATEINVDYIYEIPGLARDLLIDYQHGRSLRDEAAAELRHANDALGSKARTMASALRAAGLSIRDSAAVMDLSKSRFEQLCQG
jgi:DNA-directed RNA polymerase specialized sigma24 family protein